MNRPGDSLVRARQLRVASSLDRIQLRDLAASVRQQLINRSRERDEDVQLVLSACGLERLLLTIYSLGYILYGIWQSLDILAGQRSRGRLGGRQPPSPQPLSCRNSWQART